MKVLVYNFKGGVGKTAISLNLSLTLNMGIVTNDVYSPLEKVLPEQKLLKLRPDSLLPSFPKELDVIFDFGGYIDARAVSALKAADLVIIPTINDFIDLQITINTVKELEQYNKNILIVANKSNEKDIENIKNIILQTVKCEKIYLFGSYAYGTPNKDSDYDFYVVVPDDGIRPLEVMQNVSLALIGKSDRKAVDILAKRHSDFERRKNMITLEREVYNKGVVLYEH